MLPTLLRIGSFEIYAYGVFLFLGLFLGLFAWWRMGKEENLDETKMFDAAFLAIFTYFVVGRGAYAVSAYAGGMSFWQAVALLAYPGIVSWAGIAGAVVAVMFFSRAHQWKGWKIMDMLVVSLALVIAVVSVGALLNGSNPGRELGRFGLFYPGREKRVFPIDLFTMIWFAVVFAVAAKVRRNFRFYEWYKAGKNVVKDGLASAVFLQMVGWYYLGRSFLDDDLNEFFRGGNGMRICSVAMILISMVLIYTLSGRSWRDDWLMIKLGVQKKKSMVKIGEREEI